MLRPHPSLPLSDQPLTEQPIRPYDGETVDVEAVGRFLRRHGRRCLMWFIGSLLAAGVFFIFAPSYYTAIATILLEQPAAPGGQNGGDAAARAEAYVESQVLVLQSADVLGRVVQKNGLIGHSAIGLGTRLRMWIKSLLPEDARILQPDPKHAAILGLKRSLSVQRAGTSNVVDIGLTAKDPSTAAKIANAVVDAYIAQRTAMRREANEAVRADLRARLADLRRKAFTAGPSQPLSIPAGQSEEQARLAFHESQNEVTTYRMLYDTLLQRLYNETPTGPEPGLQVLTRAEPPVHRSWPPPALALAVVVAGSGLGLLEALVKAMADHTLWTVADIRREVGFQRAVVIPRTQQRNATQERRNAASQMQLAASPTFVDALSRVVIGLGGESGSLGGMMIGVVAPARGAGASTVAMYLAAMIAEHGQRTVLVDANWSKPPRAVEGGPRSGRVLASRSSTLSPGAGELRIVKLRATGPASGASISLSISTTLRETRNDAACVVVDFLSLEQSADIEACLGQLQKVVVVAEARMTTSGQLLEVAQRVGPEVITAVVLNKT